MKRGHEKRGNQKKINFYHFQKRDLRTGFSLGHLPLEGPIRPLVRRERGLRRPVIQLAKPRRIPAPPDCVHRRPLDPHPDALTPRRWFALPRRRAAVPVVFLLRLPLRQYPTHAAPNHQCRRHHLGHPFQRTARKCLRADHHQRRRALQTLVHRCRPRTVVYALC